MESRRHENWTRKKMDRRGHDTWTGWDMIHGQEGA